MYWARLIGIVVALSYIALFMRTLRRRGSEHYLGSTGVLRFISTLLGVLLGLALAWHPYVAAPVLLVWVVALAISSWADYFQERK